MRTENKSFVIVLIITLLWCVLLLGAWFEEPKETAKEPEQVIVFIPEPIQLNMTIIEEPVEQVEEQYILDVTEAEIDLLARLVSAEAKGESFEGMVAVANVVINRLNNPKWKANTIHEVIFMPKQFEPVSNGAIGRQPTEQALNATIEALKGAKVVSDEVDCFANKRIDFSSWAVYNCTIGNHKFWVAN